MLTPILVFRAATSGYTGSGLVVLLAVNACLSAGLDICATAIELLPFCAAVHVEDDKWDRAHDMRRTPPCQRLTACANRQGEPLKNDKVEVIRPLLVRKINKAPEIRLAVTNDGRTVAVGSFGREVSLWDTRSFDKPRLVRTQGRFLALSPDGETLVTGDMDYNAGDFVVSEIETGSIVKVVQAHPRSLTTTPVLSASLSLDGKRFATVGLQDQVLKVWDVSSWEMVAEKDNSAGQVALSPDGRMVAVANGVGELEMWSVVDKEKLWRSPAHSGQITSLAFSRDGARLATGGTDGLARLWSSIDGRPLFTGKGHRGTRINVAFSHDGLMLAVGGSDGRIEVWESVRGERRHILREESEPIVSLMFASVGSYVYLCAVSEEGLLLIWKLPDR